MRRSLTAAANRSDDHVVVIPVLPVERVPDAGLCYDDEELQGASPLHLPDLRNRICFVPCADIAQRASMSLRLRNDFVEVLALVERDHRPARPQNAQALANPACARPLVPLKGSANIRRRPELAGTSHDRRVGG